PGYVALAIRRPTVALDGLTGDFDFQDDLRDHGAACTLERLGVTHLVTDAPGRLQPVPGHPGRRSQEAAAWLHDADAGTIEVEDRAATSAVGLERWRVAPTCWACLDHGPGAHPRLGEDQRQQQAHLEPIAGEQRREDVGRAEQPGASDEPPLDAT